MPPHHPASGGLLRRTLIAAALVVAVLGAYAFVELGSFLAREDPLQKADAILVLSGTSMRRPLEAAHLYLDGYSSRIVLPRQTRDRGELALAARGVPFAEDVERVRTAFVQLGIPAEAIVIPPRIHDNTAEEAITLREMATALAWRRVIVVTSKYHLRRARFAVRRELRDAGVEVIMHATRYDGLQPHGWWRRRADVREVVAELPRLIAYVLGLGA